MALESAGLGTWWWNLATDEVVCDSRFKSLVGIPQNEPNILLMSSILAHLQVADVELTKSAIKESVNTNGEFDIFHRVVWPDDTIHWVRLKGGPLKQGPDTEMCGIAIDGKWAAELKRSAMSLGSRILKLQDEERRKIGRELHDSLGQYLAALKMNLIVLKEPRADCDGPRDSAGCISDCVTLVERCLQETRTLSHLLHPPLLDEVGFVFAAKWFVEGFATRSGLLVRCDIPFDLPRFGNNTELCLFRVLQETITNAHTHSGCRALNIRVQFDSAKVILTVEDDGEGIAPDRLTLIHEGTGPLGIGLSGMKERICDLGGHMYVYSGKHGTSVRAVVPITFRAPSADAQDARPPGVAA